MRLYEKCKQGEDAYQSCKQQKSQTYIEKRCREVYCAALFYFCLRNFHGLFIIVIVDEKSAETGNFAVYFCEKSAVILERIYHISCLKRQVKEIFLNEKVVTGKENIITRVGVVPT